MEDVKDGRDYSFSNEELKILQLWDDIDAFQEQLRRSEGKSPYVFYDGPPFATGLPHYGHLLAGTLKVGCRQELMECLHLPCRVFAELYFDWTALPVSHCSRSHAGRGHQIRHGNRPLLPQALWVSAAWPAWPWALLAETATWLHG